MPDDKNLTDEAHRVASETVDAVEAFAQSAVHLPADAARLALDAVQAALDKAKAAVRGATK